MTLIKIYLIFSGLFMFIGVLFDYHAIKTYETARQIMETLIKIILREGRKEEF